LECSCIGSNVMATKLTDKIVKNLPPPTGVRSNRITYDSEVKGFGARKTKNGACSFVLNYRTRDGVERRLTIGSHPDWPVAEAREEARRLKRVIDQGGDPLSDRRALREAPTMVELTERYMREHAIPHKRPQSRKEDAGIIQLWILPELGDRKVAALRYADIAALHLKMSAKAPTRANRAVSLLSKMFSLARQWEWRDGDNPAKGIIRNPENQRKHYVRSNELVRFLTMLRDYPRRTPADAITLLLLTGARPAEVYNATWSQFDLADGIWVKPAARTKQWEEHRVPLSVPAVELLVARSNAATDRYVFPGQRADRPMTDARKAWRAIRSQAELPPETRLYDLRHTFASTLASAGLSLPIIGELLGHTQVSTTKRYAHLFDEPLRAATEMAATLLIGVQEKPGAEILPLQRETISE
jgi:integrase